MKTNVSTFAENIEPALPEKLTEPVTPSEPVICVDPDICALEFTLKPYAGSVEAVTLPDDINERLSPTTLDAEMFVMPAPLPKNEPENEPLNGPLPAEA